MKKKISTQISVVLLLGLFAISVVAYAEDIKARMKTRLPKITELKAKGVVGENNKGYLEFIGGQKESADVVAAENKDRETVYAAIAKQQETTAELVGKRRALQIANRAKPGQWIQDADGNWIQKN